jgi:hypothetical protein
MTKINNDKEKIFPENGRVTVNINSSIEKLFIELFIIFF